MPVRRWLVSGRVQGVFFRESTRREAARLGIISGHALNTSSGGVDVSAKGTEQQLDELEKWLWVGPIAADVKDVKLLPEVGHAESSFITGRATD